MPMEVQSFLPSGRHPAFSRPKEVPICKGYLRDIDQWLEAKASLSRAYEL